MWLNIASWQTAWVLPLGRDPGASALQLFPIEGGNNEVEVEADQACSTAWVVVWYIDTDNVEASITDHNVDGGRVEEVDDASAALMGSKQKTVNLKGATANKTNDASYGGKKDIFDVFWDDNDSKTEVKFAGEMGINKFRGESDAHFEENRRPKKSITHTITSDSGNVSSSSSKLSYKASTWRQYFYNRITGSTRWDAPVNWDCIVLKMNGWSLCSSEESGYDNLFWLHVESGRSVWAEVL